MQPTFPASTPTMVKQSQQLTTPSRSKPAPKVKSSSKKPKAAIKPAVEAKSKDRPSDKIKCRVCHAHHPMKNLFSYENKEFDRSEEAWMECIVCTECMQQFHLGCVGLEPFEQMLTARYVCSACSKEDRRTTNKTAEELDETDNKIGSQPWINNILLQKQFPSPPTASSQEDYGLRVIADGAEFAKDFKADRPWKSIFLIKFKKDLGLQVPQKPFGMNELIKLMGVNPSLWLESVIDVTAQETTRMTLSTFSRLFNLKASERERIYNILSLEYSKTGLAAVVIPPEIYRLLSLADRYWPLHGDSAEKCESKHAGMRPAVERFVLIGMGGSYTDWHIDFGGSSVWYHVFTGEKAFLVAPPTPKNLKLFEAHKNLEDQSTVFLGDALEGCSRVVIKEGQTLLVPSGWIHAVYTPVDSIVFGGNFLTLQGLQMQLEIQRMDTRRELGDVYGYPFFDTVMFYTALSLTSMLNEHNEKKGGAMEEVFPYIEGAAELVTYLTEDKEVTSMKKKPTKFARGLTKKEIVQELDAAVKVAQQRKNAPEDLLKLLPKIEKEENASKEETEVKELKLNDVKESEKKGEKTEEHLDTEVINPEQYFGLNDVKENEKKEEKEGETEVIRPEHQLNDVTENEDKVEKMEEDIGTEMINPVHHFEFKENEKKEEEVTDEKMKDDEEETVDQAEEKAEDPEDQKEDELKDPANKKEEKAEEERENNNKDKGDADNAVKISRKRVHGEVPREELERAIQILEEKYSKEKKIKEEEIAMLERNLSEKKDNDKKEIDGKKKERDNKKMEIMERRKIENEKRRREDEELEREDKEVKRRRNEREQEWRREETNIENMRKKDDNDLKIIKDKLVKYKNKLDKMNRLEEIKKRKIEMERKKEEEKERRRKQEENWRIEGEKLNEDERKLQEEIDNDMLFNELGASDDECELN